MFLYFGEVQTNPPATPPPSSYDLPPSPLLNSKLFSKSNKTEQIDYRYTNCNDFWQAGFGAAFHVLKLSDIPNWNQNSELRVTLETSNKEINNIPVCIYRFNGNPYQYGIH